MFYCNIFRISKFFNIPQCLIRGSYCLFKNKLKEESSKVGLMSHINTLTQSFPQVLRVKVGGALQNLMKGIKSIHGGSMRGLKCC